MRLALLLLSFVASVVTPVAAAAQPKLEAGAPAAANHRYLIGRNLYVKGDIAGAAREFESALLIFPTSAKLAFNLARCRERLSDNVAAVKWYRRYMELDPEGDDLRDLIAGLEAKIEQARPKLLISTMPAGAKIYLDDAAEPTEKTSPITVRLTAGPHVIRAELEGYEPQVQSVTLGGDGGKEALHIDLKAIEVATPAPIAGEWVAPTRTGPITAGALGLVAAGTGVYFLMQAADNSDAAGALSAGQSNSEKVDALERDFDRNKRLGVIFTTVGAAGIAASTAWWLLQDTQPILVAPAPDGVTFQGRF